MILTTFNKTDFLNHYWQKKPCVIKQFVSNFEDPIDENELAGLAQEEVVDSRIIARQNDKWSVTSGPITDFETPCQGAWSILVQGVDRHIPEVEALSDLIDFIPKWRMDDVMVSYSVKDAGVGPHIDEYDVFIIQGKGSRRWQVGLPSQHKTIIPHPLLKQIEAFDTVIDEVLMPGDAVYIPPKHPHNGRALEACMNYSIGFRAPTNLELMNQIVDEDVFTKEVVSRYLDISAQHHEQGDALVNQHVISSQEVENVKSQLIKLITHHDSTEAILRVLSRQHLDLSSLEESEALSTEEVKNMHQYQTILYRALGLKPLIPETQTPNNFVFYIEGESFSVSAKLKSTLCQFLTASEFVLSDDIDINLLSKETEEQWFSFVQKALNSGYWIYEEPVGY